MLDIIWMLLHSRLWQSRPQLVIVKVIPIIAINYSHIYWVITLGSLISSTARTGNYLLTLRSETIIYRYININILFLLSFKRTVDPKDKSFAMGMMSTFMALFGN